MFSSAGVDDGRKNKTLFNEPTNTEPENIRSILDPLRADIKNLEAECQRLIDSKERIVSQANNQQELHNRNNSSSEQNVEQYSHSDKNPSPKKKSLEPKKKSSATKPKENSNPDKSSGIYEQFQVEIMSKSKDRRVMMQQNLVHNRITFECDLIIGYDAVI